MLRLWKVKRWNVMLCKATTGKYVIISVKIVASTDLLVWSSKKSLSSSQAIPLWYGNFSQIQQKCRMQKWQWRALTVELTWPDRNAELFRLGSPEAGGKCGVMQRWCVKEGLSGEAGEGMWGQGRAEEGARWGSFVIQYSLSLSMRCADLRCLHFHTVRCWG